MDLTIILIFSMLFAVLLSIVSIVVVIIFLLRTNSKIRGLPKLFKLYTINNLVEKVMKKNDNQYENLENFYHNYIIRKTDSPAGNSKLNTDRLN